MKNLITILFLVISFVSFSKETNKFSEREIQMMVEINRLRVNPKSYIPKTEAYIVMCNKKLEKIKGGTLTTTGNIQNQIDAANELIDILNNTPSLNELIPNEDMFLITKSHGEYLKSINSTSHKGPNGKLAPKRMSKLNFGSVTENIVNDNGMIGPTILLLLVDAGIDSRGHRNNLLDPNAKYISVYTNGTYWIQNFTY